MANIAVLTMSRRGTPVYISYDAFSAQPATSADASAPSRAIAGDLLVSFAWADEDTAWTGFSNNTIRATLTTEPSLKVGTELDTDGSQGGFTANVSPFNQMTTCGCQIRVRGAVYDTIGTIATTTSNGTFSVGGITSAGGLALLLVVGRTAVTCTTPSGWTAIANVNPSPANSMRLGIFSKEVQAGATGSVDTTIGSVAGTVGGVIIGLK